MAAFESETILRTGTAEDSPADRLRPGRMVISVRQHHERGWNYNFMTDFYVNEDTADDDVELTISATVLPINLLRGGGEMDKESQKLLKQHKRGAWLSP